MYIYVFGSRRLHCPEGAVGVAHYVYTYYDYNYYDYNYSTTTSILQKSVYVFKKLDTINEASICYIVGEIVYYYEATICYFVTRLQN